MTGFEVCCVNPCDQHMRVCAAHVAQFWCVSVQGCTDCGADVPVLEPPSKNMAADGRQFRFWVCSTAGELLAAVTARSLCTLVWPHTKAAGLLGSGRAPVLVLGV